MKVKVSEATEVQLDWMVAKAEGHKLVMVPGRGTCQFYGVQVFNEQGGYALMPFRTAAVLRMARDADYPGVFTKGTQFWIPSTDWSQGGPIIDQSGMTVGPTEDPTIPQGAWMRYQDQKFWMAGTTKLIAAMRCYVTSKLGDEVEVPDELA